MCQRTYVQNNVYANKSRHTQLSNPDCASFSCNSMSSSEFLALHGVNHNKKSYAVVLAVTNSVLATSISV